MCHALRELHIMLVSSVGLGSGAQEGNSEDSGEDGDTKRLGSGFHSFSNKNYLSPSFNYISCKPKLVQYSVILLPPEDDSI